MTRCHPTRGCFLAAAWGGLLAAAVTGTARSEQAVAVQKDKDQDLAKAFADARERFRQPTAEDQRVARAAVETASKALSRKLAGMPTGQSAADKLRLDVLAGQLAQADPDVAELESVLAALRTNRPALTEPALGQLRLDLRVWLERIRGAATDQGEYLEQLNRLEQVWQEYAEAGKPESLAGVQASWRWLADRGQAAELLALLGAEISRPNHFMRVSGRFVETALRRPVTQPLVSNETVDGARIRLNGTINGTVSGRLEPHPSMGALAVRFDGVGNSRINIRKGPVTVWASARTNVGVAELVYFSEKGVQLGKPAVRMANDVRPYAANLNVRCRLLRRAGSSLILRIAWRKKAESDRQASQRARRQVEEQIAGQGSTLIQELNETMGQFTLPALGGPEPATQVRLRTTAAHLEYTARHAYAWQFAAPTPPPALAAQPAVLLQVHESALNNAGIAVAGRRVSEPDFREIAFETFGLVPEGDEAIEGRIPGAITLAEERPVNVRLQDGKAHLTLRLESFEAGDQVHDGRTWTVETAYRPIVTETQVALVRDGDIRVQPADAEGAEMLEELLEWFLVKRASQSGLSVVELARSQQLEFSQLSLEHGWLTLALEHLPPPVSQPARTARSR